MAVDRVEAYRAKKSPERCSSIMMPIQETLMRKNQAAEPSLVFNVSHRRASWFKLECVKQGNQNRMHVQKTEAGRPSHGVQTFVVDDELQWDPRHSTQVARAASQCVPDRNAHIQLTGRSGARLKRQVWTSLLWLMTALWAQVNVLSDRGTSWAWNVIPRSSKG